MPRQIRKRVGQFLADDEHDAAETGATGIEYGVVDERLARWPDAVDLFQPSVARPEACGHHEQRRHLLGCRRHYIRSSSAREMLASPRSRRRGGDPKLIRMCRGDSKKRPGTTSVEYRFNKCPTRDSASTPRGTRGNTTLPPSGMNA